MKSNMSMNLLRALLVTLFDTMTLPTTARQSPPRAGRKPSKRYDVPHGGGAREVARRARQIDLGQLQTTRMECVDRWDQLLYRSNTASGQLLSEVPGLMPLPDSLYRIPGWESINGQLLTRRGSVKMGARPTRLSDEVQS